MKDDIIYIKKLQIKDQYEVSASHGLQRFGYTCRLGEVDNCVDGVNNSMAMFLAYGKNFLDFIEGSIEWNVFLEKIGERPETFKEPKLKLPVEYPV